MTDSNPVPEDTTSINKPEHEEPSATTGKKYLPIILIVIVFVFHQMHLITSLLYQLKM
jgi:hypothetical protein